LIISSVGIRPRTILSCVARLYGTYTGGILLRHRVIGIPGAFQKGIDFFLREKLSDMAFEQQKR
jgi:hypothetical protein